MKRIIPILLLTVIGVLWVVRMTVAQGTDLHMGPWVIGSAGRSQSDTITVQGAAGQSAAGLAQGGEFTLKGGLWSIMAAAATPERTFNLLLPVVLQQPPPIVIPTITPTVTPVVVPTRVWQRVGGGGQMAAALAIQGEQLFMADRRDFTASGGLYRRSIANCESTLTTTLTRFDTIQSPGFGLVFQGVQGVMAAFGGKIYYSADSGNHWTQTTSDIPNPRTVATAGNSAFYAGTDQNGIYRTNDGGATWQQRNSRPAKINVVRLDTLDPNTLWVGTEDDGVWVLTVDLDRLIERNSGLASVNSRKVWDFDFDSAGAIYVATFDGVFTWNGAWQPFGLQGVVQARSLAVVGDHLYAGAQSNDSGTQTAGVWRRPLVGGNWEQVLSNGWNSAYTVRDLLYDPAYCKGVLAATNDGVWVYK